MANSENAQHLSTRPVFQLKHRRALDLPNMYSYRFLSTATALMMDLTHTAGSFGKNGLER